MSNVEAMKPKRGRKSKKDLMASLNIQSVVKKVPEEEPPKQTDVINMTITEDKEQPITEANIDTIEEELNNQITAEEKVTKKRGRKPKGGKIIVNTPISNIIVTEKQNVILHLKCHLKDLQTPNNPSGSGNYIESYSFLGHHNTNLNYEIIGGENIHIINNSHNSHNSHNGHNINNNDDNDDYDCDDEESVNKDATKEIWRKLKQLEHNLHINNVNNKKSCCFWDTCEFDNPPVYIPKHFFNNSYEVYGCFCSPECGVAYLMNETLDSSTKFERYHMFNHIYTKIYNYKKNIKPAPNPLYMLDKFYGNLSIQEYRSLLRNERLFLIVDKPLTRVLPELHEDNDDFILNNKIIPSNTYQINSRLQRKKQNKNSILNEKFGNYSATCASTE
jgi:hypothetical protein